MSSTFGGVTTAILERKERQEEFPIIREQDLAIILGDWARLKVAQPPPSHPGETDALDFTIIVAELSRGLHHRSLTVIYNALPSTEKWTHLRRRLEQLIAEKQADEFVGYEERQIPVH